MVQQPTVPATATPSDPQPTAGAPAPLRWLRVTRMVWLVMVLAALGILVASIPGYVLAASQVHMGGHRIEAPVWLVAVLALAGALASFVAALVCLALAGLLFWRKAGNRMALYVSFYLLVYGIVLAGPLDQLDALLPGSAALEMKVLGPLVYIWPTVALLVLFPTGRFVPPWTRWLLFSVVLLTPLLLYFSYFASQWRVYPSTWLIWPVGIYLSLTLAAAGYAQVFRYRHVSSPIEQQQAKWAVTGLLLWGLLATVAGVLEIVLQRFSPGAVLPWWIPFLGLYYWLALDIVPLTLTVALLRYRLFDIDLLIRRTLVYGTLTATLGAIYVVGVLGVQAVVQALTGQTGQQPVFTVASTLLVAALFNPLRRRIQAVIDQRFYRRKYLAARTLAAFGATLRTETDLEQLTEQLVAVVQETMQPAHVSLWLRPPGRWADHPDQASQWSEPQMG